MSDIVGRLLRMSGLALGLLAASTAIAQQPPSTRIRGTIEKVEGSVLTVQAEKMGEVKVALADGAQVFAIGKGTLADVKPGGFIGVGAMPQPDGSQRAIQVTVFAESLHGLGEGHRAWDRPGSTMTNATVETTVASVDGQTAMVKYRDGEQKIIITPEAVIRVYLPSDRSELKPGVMIAGNAIRKPDGNFEVSRLNVGRDGMMP